MVPPRLRPALDAHPVRLDGRDYIAMRDPEGLLDGPVLLPPGTFAIASLLDGARDLREIQVEYLRRSGGHLLLSDDLRRIVDELDRRWLLESPALQARRDAMEAAFRASPVRPPAHAGTAYPADSEALRRDLAGHLAAASPQDLSGLSPRGILAPHIDLARGGWCYGWAYAALARRLPRAVLLLGVAHTAPPAPVILTTKPYLTPLGEVPVDSEAAHWLQERLGDLTTHETAHRVEHSLEFQALFLQAISGDRPPRVVPLLVSAFEHWVPRDRTPRAVQALEDTAQVLRDLVVERAGEMAVVAGVDFSHVGARFGDREAPSVALGARTSLRDHQVLDAIVRGDADEFWHRAMEDGNRQRIDALSAVYLALRVLAPATGRLLRYGQATDPADGIVSFASMALL